MVHMIDTSVCKILLDLQLGRYCWEASPRGSFFHLFLLAVSAALSASHVDTDWLLDLSFAAKWARLLITNLAVTFPTHQRSKYSEGSGVGVVAYSGLMH